MALSRRFMGAYFKFFPWSYGGPYTPWVFPRQEPNTVILLPYAPWNADGQAQRRDAMLDLIQAYQTDGSIDEVVMKWKADMDKQQYPQESDPEIQELFEHLAALEELDDPQSNRYRKEILHELDYLGIDPPKKPAPGQSDWQRTENKTYIRPVEPGKRTLANIALQPIFPKDIPGAGREDYERIQERIQDIDEAIRGTSKEHRIRKYHEAEQKELQKRLESYHFYASAVGLGNVAEGQEHFVAALQYPEHNADLRAGLLPPEVLARTKTLALQPGTDRQREERLTKFIQRIQGQPEQRAIAGGVKLPLSREAFITASAAVEPQRQEFLENLSIGIFSQKMKRWKKKRDEQRPRYREIEQNIQKQYGKISHEQLAMVTDQSKQKLMLAGPGSGKTTTMAAKFLDLVTNHGVDPRTVLFASPTNSGRIAFLKSIEKTRSLHANLPKYEQLQKQFSTIHGHMLSFLNQPYINEEEEEGEIQSALQQMGRRDYKLLGGNKSGKSGNNPNDTRTHFLQKILKRSDVKDIEDYITAVKSSAGRERYNQAMERGKQIWKETNGRTDNLDAQFYRYQQSMEYEKRFDFDDIIQMYLDAAKAGWMPSIGTMFLDEIQEMTPKMIEALAANTTERSRIIAAGDLGQQVTGTGRRVDKLFKRFLPEISEQTLTANFRSSHRVVELSNAANMHPALQERGTSPIQVSMSENPGLPETYDLGKTFQESHSRVFDRLFALLQLTPEQIQENLSHGRSPFATRSEFRVGQAPIIVNQHEEQDMLRKHLSMYLQQVMGFNHQLSKEIIDQGITEAVPGSQEGMEERIHLLTTASARSQGFQHPFVSVTGGGLWDEADRAGLRMTMMSRAEDAENGQLHIFATSQNFSHSPWLDNAFEPMPGTLGSELVPHGYGAIREQAQYLGEQLHGRPMDNLVQLSPEEYPDDLDLSVTPEQAAAIEKLMHSVMALYKIVPPVLQQGSLDGIAGILQADPSDIFDIDKEGDKGDIGGFSYTEGSTMAQANFEEEKLPPMEAIAYARRYAEQMLLSDDRYDVMQGTMSTHDLSDFIRQAQRFVGPQDWRQFPDRGFDYPGYDELGKIAPTSDEQRPSLPFDFDRNISKNMYASEAWFLKNLHDFLGSHEALYDPDLQKALDVEAFKGEEILRFGKKLLSSDHLEAIAKSARKIAQQQVLADPAEDKKYRRMLSELSATADGMTGLAMEQREGEQTKSLHFPKMKLSEEDLMEIGRRDPQAAFFLDAILRDPKLGLLVPIQKAGHRVKALHNTILGAMRGINSPEHGQRLGITRSFSAATPAMQELASLANAAENTGVRDPHDVLFHETERGEPLYYQRGGLVSLSSLEQRLHDLTRRNGFESEEARSQMLKELVNVERVQMDLQNPRWQQQAGWTLNQMYLIATGGTRAIDPEAEHGLSRQFRDFTEPFREQGTRGDRTFDQIMELHDALEDAHQSIKKQGVIKRGQINHIMHALQLNPNDPKWNLKNLEQHGFTYPEDELPLYSITNPKNLTELLSPGADQSTRAKLLEQMQRQPFYPGQMARIVAGKAGNTPILFSQQGAPEEEEKKKKFKPIPGMSEKRMAPHMHVRLEPYIPEKLSPEDRKNFLIGAAVVRNKYLTHRLFTQEESEITAKSGRFNENTPLPPIYKATHRTKTGEERSWLVRGDQIELLPPENELPPIRPEWANDEIRQLPPQQKVRKIDGILAQWKKIPSDLLAKIQKGSEERAAQKRAFLKKDTLEKAALEKDPLKKAALEKKAHEFDSVPEESSPYALFSLEELQNPLQTGIEMLRHLESSQQGSSRFSLEQVLARGFIRAGLKAANKLYRPHRRKETILKKQKPRLRKGQVLVTPEELKEEQLRLQGEAPLQQIAARHDQEDAQINKLLKRERPLPHHLHEPPAYKKFYSSLTPEEQEISQSFLKGFIPKKTVASLWWGPQQKLQPPKETSSEVQSFAKPDLNAPRSERQGEFISEKPRLDPVWLDDLTQMGPVRPTEYPQNFTFAGQMALTEYPQLPMGSYRDPILPKAYSLQVGEEVSSSPPAIFDSPKPSRRGKTKRARSTRRRTINPKQEQRVIQELPDLVSQLTLPYIQAEQAFTPPELPELPQSVLSTLPEIYGPSFWEREDIQRHRSALPPGGIEGIAQEMAEYPQRFRNVFTFAQRKRPDLSPATFFQQMQDALTQDQPEDPQELLRLAGQHQYLSYLQGQSQPELIEERRFTRELSHPALQSIQPDIQIGQLESGFVSPPLPPPPEPPEEPAPEPLASAPIALVKALPPPNAPQVKTTVPPGVGQLPPPSLSKPKVSQNQPQPIKLIQLGDGKSAPQVKYIWPSGAGRPSKEKQPHTAPELAHKQLPSPPPGPIVQQARQIASNPAVREAGKKALANVPPVSQIQLNGGHPQLVYLKPLVNASQRIGQPLPPPKPKAPVNVLQQPPRPIRLIQLGDGKSAPQIKLIWPSGAGRPSHIPPSKNTVPPGVGKPPPPPPRIPPTAFQPGPDEEPEDPFDVAKGDVLSWIMKGSKVNKDFPTPNPEQLAFYQSKAPYRDIEGGPGSGKTDTMIRGFLAMATEGRASPRNMQTFSYGRSGVAVLNERLDRYNKYLAQQHPDFQFPEAMTYDRFAGRIIGKGSYYDQDLQEEIYPALEKLPPELSPFAPGVKYSGRIIWEPSKSEREAMSEDELKMLLTPQSYLQGALTGEGWSTQRPDQLKKMLEDIKLAKSNRTGSPSDPYSIMYATGLEHRKRGLQTSEAALVIMQEAFAHRGDMDFQDRRHIAAQILQHYGIQALPPEMQSMQVIGLDEKQDTTHDILNMMGSLYQAIAPNNPQIVTAGDMMQAITPERFGNIPPNDLYQEYANHLGTPEEHVLRTNYRSNLLSILFGNGLLRMGILRNQRKSPEQRAAYPKDIGSFPLMKQAPHQPAMYEQMMNDMLKASGISYGTMKHNLSRGLPLLHGVKMQQWNPDTKAYEGPGALALGRSFGVFSQHADKELFENVNTRKLQRRLKISPEEAKDAFKQLFYVDEPGGQRAEGDNRIMLSLQAAIRSRDASNVFADVTQVGGGDFKQPDSPGWIEYIRRLLVTASRLDRKGGKNQFYYTRRPFDKIQRSIYNTDPSLLKQHGNKFTLGTYADKSPRFLLEDKQRNIPEQLGGAQVPGMFAEPLHHTVDQLLQQGMSPYSSVFKTETQDFRPFALQRARQIGIIPEAAFTPGLPASLGPRFWTRQDLAKHRANTTPGERDAIAGRLVNYPEDVEDSFVFNRQQQPGLTPEDFIQQHIDHLTLGHHVQMLDDPNNSSAILEMMAHLQYAHHLKNHPQQLAQQVLSPKVAARAKANVQAAQVAYAGAVKPHASSHPTVVIPQGMPNQGIMNAPTTVLPHPFVGPVIPAPVAAASAHPTVVLPHSAQNQGAANIPTTVLPQVAQHQGATNAPTKILPQAANPAAGVPTVSLQHMNVNMQNGSTVILNTPPGGAGGNPLAPTLNLGGGSGGNAGFAGGGGGHGNSPIQTIYAGGPRSFYGIGRFVPGGGPGGGGFNRKPPLGPDINVGGNNNFVNLGRTMARIGDEMQFIGQNMQKTADSAAQEGGDYRHATLMINRDPNTKTDVNGTPYSSLNRGQNQTESGTVVGGASTIVGTAINDIINPLAPFYSLYNSYKDIKNYISGFFSEQSKSVTKGSSKGTGASSAGGDNGTQGFFDFTSNAPGTIGYLQQNTLPMFSDTQIAQNIQAYLAAQNEYFNKGSLNASTDVQALSAMSGVDAGTISSQLADITGYTGGRGGSKDQQVANLAGIMQKMFKGNLSEQNVAPFLQAMDQVVPQLAGVNPLSSANQSDQAAAIFQLALNSGMSAQNLPTVANTISSLISVGSNPSAQQQYFLAQQFGTKNLTASPGYWEYLSSQLQNQQQLGQLGLQQNIFSNPVGPNIAASKTMEGVNFQDYARAMQSMGLALPANAQKMSLQSVQIEADNAQINLDKVNLEQAEESFAQNQASFNFNQWMQTQQLGPIGADVSRQAYFNFERSQAAAGYNPANADDATTFQPKTPFGLQNEQFYQQMENQRSMLVLGRSPLLADAAFQQQMKNINEQENFYQRSLKLQNDQRAFDEHWGEESLQMQAEALDAQKKMLPAQLAMTEYDKAQQQLQEQYLPLQAQYLQEIMTNTQQQMSGQGPLAGKNIPPEKLIQQMASNYKADKSANRNQDLFNAIQQLGLGPQNANILYQLVQADANSGESLTQIEKQMGITNDSSLIQQLEGQDAAGSYAGQTQNSGSANSNLQQGGVGANWAQLNNTIIQDVNASNNLAQTMSGTTGLTKRMGDLTSWVSNLTGGISTLTNIIGLIAGIGGGGGGRGGAGVGGGGGSGGVSLPPLPHGIGGATPTPEGSQSGALKGPPGDPRNQSASFWINLLEDAAAMGMKKRHETTYSHFGIMNPGVNADFHAKMHYGQHQGVDFAAGQGTPLSEFVGGEVRATGVFPWGGEVDVLVPGGLTERYLHLSAISVTPGQRVKKGDHIGRTGGGTPASGLGYWSSGSHLHTQFDYGDINNGIDPWPVWAAFRDFNIGQFLGDAALSQKLSQTGTRPGYQPFVPSGNTGGAFMPGMADGGIAMKPIITPLAEDKPEVVLPLSRLKEALATVTTPSQSSSSGTYAPAGQTVSIQTLVGTMNLQVTMASSTLSEPEKDQLMADTLAVLSVAVQQVLQRP